MCAINSPSLMHKNRGEEFTPKLFATSLCLSIERIVRVRMRVRKARAHVGRGRGRGRGQYARQRQSKLPEPHVSSLRLQLDLPILHLRLGKLARHALGSVRHDDVERLWSTLGQARVERVCAGAVEFLEIHDRNVPHGDRIGVLCRPEDDARPGWFATPGCTPANPCIGLDTRVCGSGEREGGCPRARKHCVYMDVQKTKERDKRRNRDKLRSGAPNVARVFEDNPPLYRQSIQPSDLISFTLYT